MRPLLGLVLALRQLYYFVVRVFVFEPLFKGYLASCGRGVRTGVYLHWVAGRGKFVVGDNVTLDGKSSFSFAARYYPEPTLSIGSHTGIGHNCSFTIGQSITIGEHCRIGEETVMFDASGHPSDPARRIADEPAPLETIKPIVLERNVWVGRRSIIYPGVTIGENSVVSAGSVVMSSVPPNTVVAGNPARRVASL